MPFPCEVRRNQSGVFHAIAVERIWSTFGNGELPERAAGRVAEFLEVTLGCRIDQVSKATVAYLGIANCGFHVNEGIPSDKTAIGTKFNRADTGQVDEAGRHIAVRRISIDCCRIHRFGQSTEEIISNELLGVRARLHQERARNGSQSANLLHAHRHIAKRVVTGRDVLVNAPVGRRAAGALWDVNIAAQAAQRASAETNEHGTLAQIAHVLLRRGVRSG